MKKPLFVASAIVLTLLLSLLGSIGTASAQSVARIHLIHGIPGVDVDVEIGGEIAIEGFAFRDTQDLSGFAGQTLADVKVKAAGTDDVAIDIGDLALPETGNVTAIAHLDADGKPTVSIFSNDTSKLDAGQGRLVVRHTAAAPEVDVLAGGEAVFSGIANGKEASGDVPAGTVSASVVPAGATEPVVIGPADLPIAEGSSLIVYAVGSLDGDTLDVITETIDGLDGNPNAVNTGNSPVTTDQTSGLGWTLGLAVAAIAALFALVGFNTLVRPARTEV